MFSLLKYRDTSIKVIDKYFETPIGVLKSSYENIPSSKTVFQREFFIKEKKDLGILEYMYNDLDFLPTYEDIESEAKLIGEDGIVAAGVPGSPVIELIEEYMGVQNFLLFLNDFPKEMESIYNVMLAKNIEAYEIAARSPSPLLVVWEDTGIGLYSPKIFKKYVAKALREYISIAHRFGKKIFIHSCGLLNDIIEDLVKTGADGITDMSPPPTGNIDFLDVRRRVGKDVILTGGIDATAITSFNKEVLEESVINLIKNMKPYGNFILGSGDAVPANTSVKNLILIYELIEKYGYY